MHEYSSPSNYSLQDLESGIQFTEAKSFKLNYLSHVYLSNRLGFDELKLGTFAPDLRLILDNKPPSNFEIESGPHEVYISSKISSVWVARALIDKKPFGMAKAIYDVQTKLNVINDGIVGPETWGAIAKTMAVKLEADDLGLIDPRSVKNILTLLPRVRPYASALIQSAESIGIQIKVISAMRTYAEQDELYAKGRTAPGPKVTNARGGYSNHNFGIAFDIGVFEGNEYLTRSKKYKVVGALGLKLGLEWGGNWKTIVDEPHFQLRPRWASAMSERDMLAELRNRVSNGVDVYT